MRSVRGAHGGYQLTRPTAEINASDIIDAVEGPVALTECASGAGHCGIEATCQVGLAPQPPRQPVNSAPLAAANGQELR